MRAECVGKVGREEEGVERRSREGAAVREGLGRCTKEREREETMRGET